MRGFVVFLLLLFASPAFSADYAELKIALGSQDLKDKVEVAVLIMVDKINTNTDTDPGFDGANHANRVIWARRVLSDPAGAAKEAAKFLPILVAANREADLSVILAASDATVQTNVEEAVDLFADGT